MWKNWNLPEDLIEGGEYEFRVSAVNAAGVSKPSATVGPVIIRDQTCTYQHVIREGPLYGCLPRYSKIQNKKDGSGALEALRLSLDTGLLPNHLAPTELLHF